MRLGSTVVVLTVALTCCVPALAVNETVSLALIDLVGAQHRPTEGSDGARDVTLQLPLDRPAFHVGRQPQVAVRHEIHKLL